MKLFKIFLGILVALIGIYMPFYIGSLLPKGWIEGEFWWSIPTGIALIIISASVTTLGCVIISKGISE